MITWIILASTSKAKIFTVNKVKFIINKEKLVLVKEFNHPESRLRDSQIVSDKSGRYRPKNMGSDSFMEPTDPKKHEADNFAREVVNVLEAGRAADLFQDLILVTPSHFYGLINKHIHRGLKNMVSLVIEKDYTKDDEKTLVKHLKQQIG